MPHSVPLAGERRSPSVGGSASGKSASHAPTPPSHNNSYPPDDTRNADTTSEVWGASSQGWLSNGPRASERWQPYRSFDGAREAGSRHGRQPSLSEAFRNLRERRGSVTANAHELADVLKAPVSPRLIIFCLIWYMTSALTNTSSKSIMIAFPRPVTLTLVQFAFVSSWCVLLAYLASVYPLLRKSIPALKSGLRPPSRHVLMTTLPLAVFQVGGHLLSSTATARIPVSLVHTIKGLSPLFTVLAYRMCFHIRYGIATYLSLVPLTLGVMLACSAELSDNFFGILCAFGGAIIFVSQNIFSKKLFNEAARVEADGQNPIKSQKLDKLNLLCYSSGLAFVLTSPLWLWSEGFMLIGDFFHDGALDLSSRKDALGAGRLSLEFVFNGTFHFGQNIMAFVLLSMVSPVTYSVASLIKRIFVITVAIVWFGNKTTRLQGVGIVLTFLGLYLYDRTSDAAKADRRARAAQTKGMTPLLPVAEHMANPPTRQFTESPLSSSTGQLYGVSNGYVNGMNGVNGVSPEDRAGSLGHGRARASSSVKSWLAPGELDDPQWRPPDDLSLQPVPVT